MYQYFKTGKTLVIDDQYNEARPLLDALSKKHIPFVFTQGKPNSEFPLPNIEESKSQYYNLIFLDLNLDFKFAGGPIGSELEEKTFKSTHSQILNTIIRNEKRSFIILIWSNEEENYLEHFNKIFDSDIYTKKRPYKIISLNKSNYFSLTENGHEFKKDENGESKKYEELLFKEIDDALNGLEAFKFFCEWDRVVSQSLGNAIDGFMGLVNNIDIESEREVHLAKIITAISIAHSGDDGYLSSSDNQVRTDSVLLALTQILNDDIDWSVLNIRQKEFTEWQAKNKEEIKSLKKAINPTSLNTKLLIYKPNRTDLTGSVYPLAIVPLDFKKVYFDSFDCSSICKSFIKRFKKIYKLNTIDDDSKVAFEQKYCIRYVFPKAIPIDVNVSPLCDIVQNKLINHRLVSGFLISSNYYNDIKKDLAYFVKSPTFFFNEKEYFIGIDLRSFSSCNKIEIKNKEYFFTLRSNIVNDIQVKLAGHVSRLGVLSL